MYLQENEKKYNYKEKVHSSLGNDYIDSSHMFYNVVKYHEKPGKKPVDIYQKAYILHTLSSYSFTFRINSKVLLINVCKD